MSASVALASLAAAEVVFRLFERRFVDDPERFFELRRYVYAGLPASRFEPRPHTIFARPRNMHPGWPETNSLGFADEEWRLEKTPGVPRIICLGSSTTEGGHPFFLEEELERRSGFDFEVFNAGCAGWTTAETLVSYFLLVQDYAPDLIVLHDAINDVGPRSVPGYRTDYTHYLHHWDPPRFPPWRRALVYLSHLYSWFGLSGEAPTIARFTSRQLKHGESVFDGEHFPPGTDAAYRRNLITIAEHARAHGAAVAMMTMPLKPPESEREASWSKHWYVGVAEYNDIARALAEEHGWLLVDAEQAFQREEERLTRHFLDIAHLDRIGNKLKAKLIADVLLERWVPTLAGLCPAPEH